MILVRYPDLLSNMYEIFIHFYFRGKRVSFSTSEAEELIIVVISLFLDRRLEGLSVILYKCLLAAISYLTDDQWNTSCEKVAKSLANRLLPVNFKPL